MNLGGPCVLAIDPGANIGPYKIMHTLGAGGMGEGYLARDTRLGRKIALKFLSAEFTKDEERVRRFPQKGPGPSPTQHPEPVTNLCIRRGPQGAFFRTPF